MKTFFRILLTVSILTATPQVQLLNAGVRSVDGYELSYDAIREVVHKKGNSMELDIPLYIAQSITMDVMNECDQIGFIHNPRLSPDQSMVFIGYFLNDEPGELHIIYLRQATLGAKILVRNDTIEIFSEYTYKHYKTKFFYVDQMDDNSLDREESKH